MYRPANYYAARTAAIAEALAEDRAQRTAPILEKMPAPYSAESLRNCGSSVPVYLGSLFGDLAGTIVDATYCYGLSKWVFLATFRMAEKQYIVECFYYNKRDDLYNYAYSLLAIT